MMRRWLIRISVGLAILIVLVIVTVQLVMWSPLPKRIVMQQIEKQLGLRISADTLTTGWLGKSTLTNVSLGLPLSSSDFLKVKSLGIKLNSLFGLAVGNAVAVDSIEIDEPDVQVVQNAQGQWNLAEVVELLGKVGGSNTAQQSTSSSDGIPKLPIVKLINGQIHIADNQKHVLELKPLNVSGEPAGNLVWNYQAKISDSIAATGKVAPGGNWRHEVTLAVQNLDPLLKGWGVPSTYAAVVKGSWHGQLSGGNVVGTLSMDQVTAQGVPTAGDVSLHGLVDLQVAGSVITLHPNQVDLKTTYVTLPNVGIQSGTIVSDAAGLHAQAVKVSALGGLANLNAKVDPRSGAVDVDASWSGLSLAKQTNQSGSLIASLRLPFANQPVIKVQLNSTGLVGQASPDAVSAPSRWNAQLDLTGQGNSWKNIDWVLTTPQLTYTSNGQVLSLSQTTAHVTQRYPLLELTDLSLPSTNITGGQSYANFTSSGRVNFATQKWNFDATGGLNTAFQGTPVPINLDLHANGTNKRYNLKRFSLGLADLTVTADGSYDLDKPTPVGTDPNPMDLHVELTQLPRLTTGPIQGEVGGKFTIVGDLFKEGSHFRPYLTVDGDLRSSDLVAFGKALGDIDIKLQGTTSTPDQPDKNFGRAITQIHTTDFSFLQAPWNLMINYPNKDDALEVMLDTRRLALDELAKFAKVQSISGQLTSAKWTLTVPSLSLAAIDLQSEYHLAKLAGPGITVDTVDATATLHDGVLRLNPLLAKNGNGTVTTTASFDLLHPRHLVTEITVDQWPYDLGSGANAVASAHSNLDVDLASKKIGANGSISASADLRLNTGKLAHTEFEATVRNRVVAISKLEGNVLTGTFKGSADVDIDRPLQATGQVVWKNVDAGAFAAVIPPLDGLGGNFSGTITLAPARDPRPLAPVRVDINVASTGGHFRSLDIGGKQLLTLQGVAYLNTDRVILDHSDIFVGGGVMHLWTRADLRGGLGISTQTALDFENLQLEQLTHIDPTQTQPTPGLLTGHIGIIRSGPNVSKLLASAHVDLTQTDLVNVGPIAALYNVMNVGGGGGSQPTGRGSVDLTFEQSVLRVTNFTFFNRGIDAGGLVNIGPVNYAHPSLTALSGQVVGAARALKQTRIALLRDFDQIFSAAQGNLTSINLSGSLGDAKYTQAGLDDLGAAVKQLLGGEVQQSQKGSQ